MKAEFDAVNEILKFALSCMFAAQQRVHSTQKIQKKHKQRR